jgi:segregation and condensation protein B
MQNGTRNSVVEALILASPEPLAARKIAEVIDDMTPHKVGQAVAELNNRYMQATTAYRIRELAGGYQFYIVPEFTGYVEELFTRRRKVRLTQAALETLAIVAYRQPVTRLEIEHIRGVSSDGVIRNLLEKKVITIRGRAATVGKPLQYGTTDEFLKFFGLNSLEDLPKMSEIEELISSREPQPQTELELEDGKKDDQAEVKLNIADGTYDPDRTIEIDEITGEPLFSEPSPVNSDTDSADDSENETDADDAEQERTGLIIDHDTVRESS